MLGHKWAWLMLTVFFALLVAGCNSGPSGSDIKNLVAQDTPDFMEVKKVEVLNSAKRDNGHLVKFETTLAFRKSYADTLRELEQAAENEPMGALMAAMMMQMLSLQFGEWQAGETFTDTTEAVFVKGSKGWMQVE
jgi:hypothetical protein